MASDVRLHYRVLNLQRVFEGAVQLLQLNQEGSDVFPYASLVDTVLAYFQFYSVSV